MVISKIEEKTLILSLIPFELPTDNHELSNKKPVSYSKGTDETHILNSRRPNRKTNEERQYLRELQDRYG